LSFLSAADDLVCPLVTILSIDDQGGDQRLGHRAVGVETNKELLRDRFTGVIKWASGGMGG